MLNRRTKARLAALSGIAVAALASLVTAGPASAAVGDTPQSTPGFNGPVYAVAVSGSIVYLGGNFTAAVVNGKQIPRERLAAVDATTGALLSWAPAADKVVRALAVSGDRVWAGGDFQVVNGQARDSLARLDGVSGALDPVQHRISGGAPRALAVGHGRLYMAGLFTAVDGAARANVAAFGLDDGALSSWAPRTDDLVTSLAVTETRVYLAGAFHQTNGITSTGRLIAVRPSDASVDLAFRPRPDSIVHSVAVSGTRVYGALGGRGGRVTSYSLSGAPQWTLTSDGDAQAVAVLGSTVYVGGHFDNVCRSNRTGDQGVCLDGSVPRVKFAATDLDGDLLSWSPTGNGIRGVLALTVNAELGAVAAVGEFTTIDGLTRKRFALFD